MSTNQGVQLRLAAQAKAAMATKNGGFVALLLLLSFLLSSPLPARCDAPLPVNVWPKPTSMSWAEPHMAVRVSSSFHVVAPSGNAHLLRRRGATPRCSSPSGTGPRDAGGERHAGGSGAGAAGRGAELGYLTLAVSDLHAPLQHGVDESYALEILPPVRRPR